jgi:hypothetical protein
MTTATTLNGLNRSLISGAAGGAPRYTAASFKMPNFAQVRAALPDMPATDSTASIVAGVAGRLALAAVPFCALGWLFITR